MLFRSRVLLVSDVGLTSSPPFVSILIKFCLPSIWFNFWCCQSCKQSLCSFFFIIFSWNQTGLVRLMILSKFNLFCFVLFFFCVCFTYDKLIIIVHLNHWRLEHTGHCFVLFCSCHIIMNNVKDSCHTYSWGIEILILVVAWVPNQYVLHLNLVWAVADNHNNNNIMILINYYILCLPNHIFRPLYIQYTVY